MLKKERQAYILHQVNLHNWVLSSLEYMQHPTIDVIMIGDRISKNSRITIGAEAIARIKQINADLCFLGTIGACPGTKAFANHDL